MAFTTFTNNTIIDADQMNDNFYWIGQGNFLPRGGASLDATSGLYDLGSSSYKWNNIYANNINCSTVTGLKTWYMASETILTASANEINVTGLNGDSAELYIIHASFVCNTNTIMKFGFNYDSSTNYCIQRLFYDYVLGFTPERLTTTSMQIYQYTRTKSTYIYYNLDAIVYAKSGIARMVLSNNGCYYSTASQRPYVEGLCSSGQMWNNSASTLTSIQFSADGAINGLAAGTVVRIYAKE